MAGRSGRKADEDFRKLHAILSDIARLYTFRDKDGICRGELSLSQCYALYALRDAGPMSLNELASYLNLEKSSVSRLVRKLLDDRLIKRSEDPDDCRKISLEVTTKGSRLYGRIEQEIMDEEEELFHGFNAAERRIAIKILTRVAANVARRDGHKCLCNMDENC